MSTAASKKKGPNYTHDEVTTLAKAWLNISQDPKVGVYQTQSSFWDRVATEYKKYSTAAFERYESSASIKKYQV